MKRQEWNFQTQVQSPRLRRSFVNKAAPVIRLVGSILLALLGTLGLLLIMVPTVIFYASIFLPLPINLHPVSEVI